MSLSPLRVGPFKLVTLSRFLFRRAVGSCLVDLLQITNSFPIASRPLVRLTQIFCRVLDDKFGNLLVLCVSAHHCLVPAYNSSKANGQTKCARVVRTSRTVLGRALFYPMPVYRLPKFHFAALWLLVAKILQGPLILILQILVGIKLSTLQ